MAPRCIKSKLAHLTRRPSVIWLCPPSPAFCFTTPRLFISLSAITAASEILLMFYLSGAFPQVPRCPTPPVRVPASEPISLSSLAWFHVFLLISETVNLALSYPWFLSVASAFSLQTSQAPVPLFLCAPHCLEQSWVSNQLSLSSNPSCWLTEKVPDISTLASLPPTQGLFGWYLHKTPQGAISATCMTISL